MLVGHQEQRPDCKKFECCDAGVVICLNQGADDLHGSPIISCFIKIQNGLPF